MRETIDVPIKLVGPLKIKGPVLDEAVMIPLATYESTLWPSINRGCKVSRRCGGVQSIIIDDRMTRSIIVEAKSALAAYEIIQELKENRKVMEKVVEGSSRFAKLLNYNFQLIGNIIFIRFEMHSGDASGHNMVTKAADHLMTWILDTYTGLTYGSISGNICTDKKVSSINAILGRGKYTVSEIVIDRESCLSILKTTPEKIVNLNIKKNYIGSIVSGGVQSANAHFANILLAIYLATGQDVANIVEGSQGIVHTEVKEGDLYFSVTLPNIIVGTVGHGKHLAFVKEILLDLGCFDKRHPSENAKRLAAIIGAATLCGELSLLAAQTNQGELVRSHMQHERVENKKK